MHLHVLLRMNAMLDFICMPAQSNCEKREAREN